MWTIIDGVWYKGQDKVFCINCNCFDNKTSECCYNELEHGRGRKPTPIDKNCVHFDSRAPKERIRV